MENTNQSFKELIYHVLRIHITWNDNVVSLGEESRLQKIIVSPSSWSVQKVQSRINQHNLAFIGRNLHEAYVDVRRSVQPVRALKLILDCDTGTSQPYWGLR
jgi:LEA14-like dessication related protein